MDTVVAVVAAAVSVDKLERLADNHLTQGPYTKDHLSI